MKKCKTIIAVVMAISMALSVFALVGCQPASEKTQRDPEVQAVYEAYVAQAEEAGEDVLSYDEWLADLKASVKGEKGDKGDDGTDGTNGKDGSSWRVGITEPANELGNDGDFYLNTETFDLYLKSEGAWSKLTNIKGTDGQNGTNGTNGEDGEDGARGNTITNGEGAPTSTEGAIEGDMYIDTTEWNVYFFNGTEWQNKNSIKGADGQNGENGENGQNGENGKDGNTWIVKDTDPTNEEGNVGDLFLNTSTWHVFHKTGEAEWSDLGCISGGTAAEPEEKTEVEEIASQTVTSSNGATLNKTFLDALKIAGDYYFEVDKDLNTEYNGFVCVKKDYSKGTPVNMVFHKVEDGVYRAYAKGGVISGNTLNSIKVANGALTAIDVTIKLFKITKYVPVTLKEGEKAVVPVSDCKVESSLVINDRKNISVKIDPALAGKSVKITYWGPIDVSGNQGVELSIMTDENAEFSASDKLLHTFTSADKQGDGSYSATVTIPEGQEYLCFVTNGYSSMRASSGMVEVEITLA